MDWIKEIIENHTSEEKGLDLNATMQDIKKEFPKNAVPKQAFNEKLSEIKVANDLISDLQTNNKDVIELQKQISDYEEEVTNLKEEQVKIKANSTLKEKLAEQGAVDIDYMMFKFGELDLDANGNVKDLDNKIKALSEEYKDMFTPKEEVKEESDKGYKPLDNKLADGEKSSNTEPNSLADAIKMRYEEV